MPWGPPPGAPVPEAAAESVPFRLSPSARAASALTVAHHRHFNRVRQDVPPFAAKSTPAMQGEPCSGPPADGQVRAWPVRRLAWDELGEGPADLRFLLDPRAGCHGFVSARDGRLYAAQGPRMRCFGVHLVFAAAFPPPGDPAALAERLARAGCNLVRIHHADSARGPAYFDYGRPGPDGLPLHAENMARFDRLFAELKTRGVHIHLDLYTLRRFLPEEGLEGLRPAQKHVPMYAEGVRHAMDATTSRLLEHRNPHTGLCHAEDPAVVVVQPINGQSMQWWDAPPRRAGTFDAWNDPGVWDVLPAAALLFHRGDVASARELHTLRADDPFAGADGTAAWRNWSAPTLPRAFRHRVAVAFGHAPGAAGDVPLGTADGAAPADLVSDTGERAWDRGAGLPRIDTPRTAGIAGFARGPRGRWNSPWRPRSPWCRYSLGTAAPWRRAATCGSPSRRARPTRGRAGRGTACSTQVTDPCTRSPLSVDCDYCGGRAFRSRGIQWRCDGDGRRPPAGCGAPAEPAPDLRRRDGQKRRGRGFEGAGGAELGGGWRGVRARGVFAFF